MANPPTLFVSLGTSQAIVPEAFLLPGVQFQAVHIITTETTETSFVERWFAKRNPGVVLSICRVDRFRDLTCEQDHHRFEETVYRWILETNTSPQDRYLCLAGGFKTMSTTMQKAATILGAAEMFHVLCDLPSQNQPTTEEDIDSALHHGHLHWIRLGPESGWPQCRTLGARDYPLEEIRHDDGTRWIRSADQSFRVRLQDISRRSRHIEGSWHLLPDLPFTELATWSEADLAWLHEPLDPQSESDRHWLKSLPKIELHCHLGGFATHGEQLSEVRQAARAPSALPVVHSITFPDGWPNVTLPGPAENRLAAYMALGDNTGSTLLRDSDCLKRHCELLYEQLVRDHILYAEIRCSPANYSSPDRSPWTVLSEIKATFDTCQNQKRQDLLPGCHINLLLIATRRPSGDFRASISRHLALALTAAEHWTQEDECRVVGVDLAGYEDPSTRAHYFREEFTGIHRGGLALTVHAGENDDAEGIWRAVFDLNARRLGHALHLIQAPELMKSVAERAIAVEMCPYANLQIKGYPLDQEAVASSTPVRYPLQQYLSAGIRVTVNSDNLGISAASLSDNLVLATRLCPGLRRIDILRLQRNSLEAAFVAPKARAKLIRHFSQWIPHP